MDYGALREIVDFAVERGIRFIDSPLTTGEVGSLSLEEQRRVIETTVDQVNGRAVVFAGVVRPSTGESALLATESEQLGADGVTAHPAYYFKLGDEEISEHFRRVARAASLPMVMYLSSYGQTSVGIGIETARELSREANIIALFPSNSDVAELYAAFTALRDDLLAFGGREELMLCSRALGLHSQSVSTGNFAPELVLKIWDLVHEGDVEGAEAQYRRLHEWRRLVQKKVGQCQAGAFSVYTKATMDLIGLPGGPPRPPLQMLSEGEVDELRSVVFDVLQLEEI